MRQIRLFVCALLLALAGSDGLMPACAGTIVLDVKALIDGRDDLIIQGDTLQWHHFDFAAVGRWEGFNVPTLISTSVDGTPIMSDFAWTPNWPFPPPNEIRFEAYSSIFSGLDPGIPTQVTGVSVATEQGVRTSIYIVQYPSAANAYTTIVEFNDDPFPGPAAAWVRSPLTLPQSQNLHPSFWPASPLSSAWERGHAVGIVTSDRVHGLALIETAAAMIPNEVSGRLFVAMRSCEIIRERTVSDM